MKVLVFAPYANAPSHHEVDLEMALKHKKAGDEVHVIHCMGELTSCDPNPFHRKFTCLSCKTQSMRSFDVAGIPRERRYPLGLNDVLPAEQVPLFKSVDEMKKFTWRGKPAGMAAAAALVSGWRDTEPDMDSKRYVISHMVSSYAAVYEAMGRHLDRIQPDLVYLFNARVAVFNAAFWAAQDRKIKTYVCDRYIFREYLLFENSPSYSIDYAKKEILELYDRMKNDPKGLEIAKGWFTTNRAGNKEILCNYLLDQVVGKLPDGFDKNKKNIAIFGSSEDEVVAAPGWENPYFKHQTDAIQYLLSQVKDPSYHFYLRVHPNLKNVNCAQVRQLESLKGSNFTIIPAADIVDSYALLEAADQVLTFGSTMGIESCFWGTPSVLAGRSFFEHLDVAYVANSRENMIELIRSDLKPKPAENSFGFGYWWRRRGLLMQHVTPQNPEINNPTSIDGIALGVSRPVYVIERAKYIVNRTLKKLAA